MRKLDGCLMCLARSNFNPLKAPQGLQRPVGIICLAHIHLNDLRPVSLACIGDRYSKPNAVACVDLRLAEVSSTDRESGIAQAEPKREKRGRT